MKLDQLLSHIDVHVEPFALCQLSSGWRLGLPGPPDAMFHFVLQGSGIVRGAVGEALPIFPYSLAVVPAGAKHSLECGREISHMQEGPPHDGPGGTVLFTAGSEDSVDLRVACGVVHVAFGDTLGLFSNLGETIVADLSGSPHVRDAFEGILREQSAQQPGGDALVSAYMNQSLVELLRHLCADPESPLPWLDALDDRVLSPVLEAVLTDVAAPHTVESLAALASMSRTTFSDHFREAFGCTPMNFVRDIRLRRAARQIAQGGHSIDSIARRVGFSSRSHFSQLFTARFGVTPAHYRATVESEISA